MAYQQNIPLATDKISISQGDLNGNFQGVNSAWNVNHVPFNLGDEGKHWFITMPNQTVSGTFPPLTNGTEIGLYAIGGNLWFRPVGQLVGDATNDINLIGIGSIATPGWSKEPNGLKMAWGLIHITNGATYLFPAGVNFVNVFSIQITPISSGVTKTYSSVYDILPNPNPTGFKATSYNANVTFTPVDAYYFAVGN